MKESSGGNLTSPLEVGQTVLKILEQEIAESTGKIYFVPFGKINNL
jgi:hypothetical protein